MEKLTPPIQDPWGGVRRGVTVTTKINRQDLVLNSSRDEASDFVTFRLWMVGSP